MKDNEKFKGQRIDELAELRQRVAELEKFETERKRVEEARKQVESEILKAHRQLSDILEFLPDATFVIDKDKKVIAWNRAIEEMTGVQKEEIIGKGDYAYAVPFYGVARPILIDMTFLSDEEIESKYDYVRKEGDTLVAETFIPSLYRGKGAFLWGAASRLYDPEGNVVGAIESIRDISTLKRAEKALYEEKERLDVTLRSIGDGVIVTDTEGTVTTLNPVAEKLTGWRDEEAAGRPLTEVFHIINEKTREVCENPVEKVMENGLVVGLANHTALIARDGTERVIADTVAPIKDKDGNIIGVVLVFRDVTEEKRAEERIEHLNAVLRAIRNVNQLITKEKERDLLLQGACNNLIETRGYHTAWIALLDKNGRLVASAEAGLGEDFLPLREQLIRGELPECAHKALSQPGVVVTKDPASTCSGCPLFSRWEEGRSAMTVQLEYGGKMYGIFSVSVHAEFIADEEEQALFAEVAEDVAFALHSMELEEERKQAEEQIVAQRDFGMKLSGTSSLEEALKACVDFAITAFGLDCGGIYLLEPETGDFVLKYVTGLSENYINLVHRLEASSEPARLVMEGLPLYIRAQDFEPPWKEIIGGEGLRAVASAPIRSHSGIIGCYYLASHTLEEVPLSGRTALESIATQTGNAIVRLQVEEDLQESEGKFRLLSEQSLVGILIVQDYVFKYANQALSDILEYSVEEMLNWGPKEYAKIIHPDDLAFVMEQAQKKQLGEEGIVVTYEWRAVTKTGKVKWIAIYSKTISFGGKPADFVTMLDITERKWAELERERLVRELEAKTKELEQIVYVTSHDLRSPLVNVQGFSKELEQSIEELSAALQSEDIPASVRDEVLSILEEDVPEALQYIHTSTTKMDSLLSGLLRLSRLGRAVLTVEKVNMNALMSEIAGAFEFHLKEKDAELVIATLPPCQGDKMQINQVFSNLLDNALKYLDPDRQGVIKISGELEDGQSVYCVEDNGIGIAPEHQTKIFEIFNQLDPSTSSGEGLGLTIVRRILDRHNGNIWVESEPGKGSKFFVALPTDKPRKREGGEK